MLNGRSSRLTAPLPMDDGHVPTDLLEVAAPKADIGNAPRELEPMARCSRFANDLRGTQPQPQPWAERLDALHLQYVCFSPGVDARSARSKGNGGKERLVGAQVSVCVRACGVGVCVCVCVHSYVCVFTCALVYVFLPFEIVGQAMEYASFRLM